MLYAKQEYRNAKTRIVMRKGFVGSLGLSAVKTGATRESATYNAQCKKTLMAVIFQERGVVLKKRAFCNKVT